MVKNDQDAFVKVLLNVVSNKKEENCYRSDSYFKLIKISPFIHL